MAKKAKIPDPLSEIAENLTGALEAHRTASQQSSDAAFLNWSQLVASQSGVSMEWALASLQKAPAKSQVIVAISDDLKSPVGLTKDTEKLARDPQVLLRLVQHPSSGCSENLPVRSVSELCKPLHKSLRKEAELWWTAHSGALPAGLNAVLKKAGKKTLVSIHDERFARPDALLSQKLVACLEGLRKAGDSAYPTLLPDLLRKAEVHPDDALLPAAFEQPPFSETVVPAGGKLPDAWLVFRADVETAVHSEGFLRRLIHRACSESSPEVKLSALAKEISKDLQPRFSEVWRTHFDLHRRFPFAEFSAAGTKAKPDLLIRDARFPRAEKLLAEQLVKILEGQKIIGEAAYPSTWKRLTELLKSDASPALIQKATTLEPFLGQVLLAFPAHPDSPVAFAEDAAELAASSALLTLALTLTVSDTNQTVLAEKVSTVKGLHPTLKPLVASAVDHAVTSGSLPGGIGALKIGGKRHLFRMSDIQATQPAPAASAAPEDSRPRPKKSGSAAGSQKSSAIAAGESSSTVVETQPPATHNTAASHNNDNFAKDLESAFERLSAESRLPGCVSLADLRPALPQFSRDMFDSELIRLRRAGQYSLSVVEGRYPLSDAEREACLVIDGTLHLLVRKR